MYKSIKLASLLVVASFLLLPNAALAAHYVYTCADWHFFSGSAACVSDIINIGSGETVSESSPGAWTYNNGQTYYFKVQQTGSGTQTYYLTGQLNNGSPFPTGTEGNTGLYTFSGAAPASNPTGNWLELSSTNFTGSLDYICVSDTSTADCPDPSGGGSTGTTTPPQIVDNPAQDVYNGMILFLCGFFGMIWFFRRNR